MGLSILDMVLMRLRAVGIRADAAFPGQRYPAITEPVAAVHIDKVDSVSQTIVVEIDMLCPAEMGGAQCELEALRVVDLMNSSGAVCSQNGCEYDAAANIYSVAVYAVFTGVADSDSYQLGAGFRVYLDGVQITHIVEFTAERWEESTLYFTMGEDEPVGCGGGRSGWKISMEELIPAGRYELGEWEGPFSLRVEKRDGYQETYTECRWISEKRIINREGIRRTRSGIAMSREDSYIGEDDL